MFPTRNSRVRQTSLVSGAFARLIHSAKRLLLDISNGMSDSRRYDDVRDQLTSVPLTTKEYTVALRRLGNAMRYARLGEKGAARYELMLLVRNFVKRRQMSEI
jgi:hypothetical protein